MPITISTVLKQIQSALSSVASSHFKAVLFSIMYIITFFGFLRVSEIAVERKNGDNNKVVLFSYAKLTVSQCELIIPSSKTDQYANSVSLIFTPFNDSSICRVRAFKRFLQLCPLNVPLFCHFSGEPVSK